MNSRTRIWITEREPIIRMQSPAIGISGEFTTDLLSRDGFRDSRTFKNIITNGLLNGIGAGTLNLQTCFERLTVGTGNVVGANAPAATDVSLVNPLETYSTTDVFPASSSFFSSGSIYYSQRQLVRQFSYDEVNDNLTELGFRDSTATILLNRSAFKDSSGDPIVISKTNNNILRVTFRYRVYSPVEDYSGSIQLGGNTYNFTARIANLSNGWYWMIHDLGKWAGICYANESGSLVDRDTSGRPYYVAENVGSFSFDPYIDGNFYRSFTVSFSNNQANFPSGIGYIGISPFRTDLTMWQFTFSPRIPKTVANALTLSFRQPFMRV
jgi:hypothetical protein